MMTKTDLLFKMFLHVNREFDDFQRDILRKVIGPGADTETREEAVHCLEAYIFELTPNGWKPERPEGDMVHRPAHYDRLPMEPTYFIVESGGYHWCIENFIKYVCRYRWKNGIEDLEKASRNLTMYLKHRRGEEGWSR